jgi:drug/metabolite transporter (DMT)-like permease
MPESSPLPQRTKAILQALLVTLLWASSWVFIKVGLGNLPPLTFAGLRYTLAFVILMPLLLSRGRRKELRSLNKRDWALLALLGIVYYSLTQGAQFVGILHLPANTLSLMLTLSAVTIALAGRIFLAERLNVWQWAGVAVSIIGALVYFGNVTGLAGIGLLVGALCVLFNTVGAILGRAVNRTAHISPLLVTVISMGIGAVLLLAAGVALEPFPALQLQDVLIIVWLAAINTAFAFTLWNLTLRTLTAAESGVINNAMLIEIAVLAWIFLGEQLTPEQIAGLVVTLLGTVMVQVSPRRFLEAQQETT